jgi:hypothetical protein
MRLFQSKEKKQETESAHSGYAEFARLAASSEPDQARTLAASFKQSEHVSSLSEKERRQRGSVAFRAYADKVLDDDRLTAEEEDAFGLVADALGVTNSEFQTTFRDVRNRLIVARMNDGRMDVIEPTTRPSAATGSQPHFMTKKDELVYLETPAKLMKEVAVREWQAGPRV